MRVPVDLYAKKLMNFQQVLRSKFSLQFTQEVIKQRGLISSDEHAINTDKRRTISTLDLKINKEESGCS